MTTPSVVSLLTSGMVTFAVGWLFSHTLKVAVPPASVVVPVVAERFTPALSLSILVRLTVRANVPL